MDQSNTRLTEVEQQLLELVTVDNQSWAKIYILMEEVEKNKLYEPEFSSFTKWVNTFAQHAKIQVSELWSRKKAGRYYAAYEARQHDQGKDVAPIQSLSVSPDNLILVEKIAGSNLTVADDLISRVVNGELARKDLSNAWKTVKAERERAGVSAVRKNAYDKPILDASADQSGLLSGKKTITAGDIVLAFRQNTWLTPIDKPYVQEKYHIMPEFAVETGTTRHARRMDILAIENLSTEEKGEVHLHGIEIKVSKHDLLNDHKMAEYRAYCDYFWLAIPEELLGIAKDNINEGWGIITVSVDGNLTVQEAAQKYDARFRETAITLALIKLL